VKEPPQHWSAEARLAAAGHRLTRQRRAVLGALLHADSGVTAAEVFQLARGACPDLGLATVYRTLEMLAEVGAVRRVHGDDRCEAYVPTAGGHGHTVVCSGCGRVGEFTTCDMRPVMAAAAAETGFSIDGHFLQLSGTCEECGRRRRIASSGPSREQS
jgi:Fur family transcriptional regulator, ferric uptake regulator